MSVETAAFIIGAMALICLVILLAWASPTSTPPRRSDGS